MSTPAVISGDFATFKHVQGRKVLQLVIEVPAEAASQVFATFGYPGSGSPIPVAIARLVEKPKAEPEHRERRAFTDLPYAQQAAMRCQEPTFWAFLASTSSNLFWAEMLAKYGNEASTAAAMIRQQCGVDSRSGIIAGQPAGDKWAALEAEYYAWQRGRR